MFARLEPMGSNVETLIPDDNVGIYILCGGASSRMGRCKTTVEVYGQTMIKRTLNTVSLLGRPTYLVGKPEQQSTLTRYDIPWISDLNATFHPLNGISAALEHAKPHFNSALFLPCDMPFLSEACMLKLLQKSPSVAVDSSGRRHPLVLHIPVSWIDRANQYLEKEESMKAFAEPATLIMLPNDCLCNLNNPSDLPAPIR